MHRTEGCDGKARSTAETTGSRRRRQAQVERPDKPPTVSVAERAEDEGVHSTVAVAAGRPRPRLSLRHITARRQGASRRYHAALQRRHPGQC